MKVINAHALQAQCCMTCMPIIRGLVYLLFTIPNLNIFYNNCLIKQYRYLGYQVPSIVPTYKYA